MRPTNPIGWLLTILAVAAVVGLTSPAEARRKGDQKNAQVEHKQEKEQRHHDRKAERRRDREAKRDRDRRDDRDARRDRGRRDDRRGDDRPVVVKVKPKVVTRPVIVRRPIVIRRPTIIRRTYPHGYAGHVCGIGCDHYGTGSRFSIGIGFGDDDFHGSVYFSTGSGAHDRCATCGGGYYRRVWVPGCFTWYYDDCGRHTRRWVAGHYVQRWAPHTCN